MRIVFMGTPAFAVESLHALAQVHQVLAVYTRPDRPAGRGRHLQSPAVKVEADSLGIPVFQPPRLGNTAVDAVTTLAPDVICVAAYGLLLPSAILDTPSYGAINVHASLLPRHRGAAPVERAILAGDTVTGVSIMQMEESLDTGPVALSIESTVAHHTTETLTDQLARIGATGLLEVLEALETGSVVWTPQDESAATYAPKISASDVALGPSLATDEALRRIRASSRRAPARLELCGVPASITGAEPADPLIEAGDVFVGKNELVLGFSDGALRVLGLRPENRREMTGAGFACGMHEHQGHTWKSLS